jgi:hypothetical protein
MLYHWAAQKLQNLKTVLSAMVSILSKQNRGKKSTLKGSRTPAACLEGKHDNRFTISVMKFIRLSQ